MLQMWWFLIWRIKIREKRIQMKYFWIFTRNGKMVKWYIVDKNRKRENLNFKTKLKVLTLVLIAATSQPRWTSLRVRETKAVHIHARNVVKQHSIVLNLVNLHIDIITVLIKIVEFRWQSEHSKYFGKSFKWNENSV